MSVSGQVLTKAALIGLKTGTDFKMIVHESKKRKNINGPTNTLETNASLSETHNSNKSTSNDFDFSKAKKEVINLGISGFDNRMKKENAEIALAIKLGAKPPKKKYRNYKEILEAKKRKRIVEGTTTDKISQKFQFGATQSYQKYAASVRFKSKKNPKNVLQDYGKVKKNDKIKMKKK